jgi:hypothetical protein
MQSQESSHLLNKEEVYKSQSSKNTDVYIDIDFNSIQNVNSDKHKNENGCPKKIQNKKLIEPIVIDDENQENEAANKKSSSNINIFSECNKNLLNNGNFLSKKKRRESNHNNLIENEKVIRSQNSEEDLEYRKRSDFLKNYHPNKGKYLKIGDNIQKESSCKSLSSEKKRLLNFKKSKISPTNKTLNPDNEKDTDNKNIDEIRLWIKSIEKKYDLLKKEIQEQDNKFNKFSSFENYASLQNLLIKLLGAAMKLTIQIDENINSKLEGKCKRCEEDNTPYLQNDIVNNNLFAMERISDGHQISPNYEYFTKSPSHMEPIQFQSPPHRQINPMESFNLQNVHSLLQFLQYKNSPPNLSTNLEFINSINQNNLIASPTNNKSTYNSNQKKSINLSQSDSNQLNNLNQSSTNLKKTYYCFKCGLPNHKASQCNKNN